MDETIRIFEVQKIVEREEDKQRIIFEYNKDIKQWIYHAPNAQDHTEKQIEIILNKLKELNKENGIRQI